MNVDCFTRADISIKYGFKVAGPLVPVSLHIPVQTFFGKHHPVVIGRFQNKFIPIIAEVKLGCYLAGHFTAEMERRVRSAVFTYVPLEPAFKNFSNHLEKTDKI
jgi:hypothetical protein